MNDNAAFLFECLDVLSTQLAKLAALNLMNRLVPKSQITILQFVKPDANLGAQCGDFLGSFLKLS